MVPHPAGHRRFDTRPGGGGDRLARLCPSSLDGALRAGAREHRARSCLGLLAPAAVLHSGSRHVRAVILRVRVAGDRTVRRDGVAVCAYQRERAARHAAARGREQCQGHRPVGPAGSQQHVWPERVSCGVAHGHALVDLRGVLPHNHETSSRDVTQLLVPGLGGQRFRRMPATTRSTPPTIATQPSKAGTVCDSWTVLWMGPKWTVPWEYKVTPLTSMKTPKPASKIPVTIRSLIHCLRDRRKLPATRRLRNPSPSARLVEREARYATTAHRASRYSMGLNDRLRTGRTDHLEARSLNVPHQVLLVLRLPSLMLRLFLSLGFRFLFGSAIECALDRHGVPD